MASLIRRRIVQSTVAAGALAALGARFARAQSLETARIICGFPPGGTSDTMSRRTAERLRGSYAKNVLVENRTGAGGQIAVQAMRGAPTDGSVILLTPASMLTIYPHIYKTLPYDAFADVVPASLACTFDFGFAVGPMVPASVTNVPQYLAWCKANPGLANFGSPGAGSLPHFVGTLVGRSAGVDLRHIPYRGSQPAIQDMVGGSVPAVSAPVGEFLAMVGAGRARLLATSGVKRNRFAPNVPTYTEQGLKDMQYSEWFGFFLPRGTPPDVVARVSTALRSALAAQDVIDGVAVMGLESTGSTPAELGALLKRDNERSAVMVKSIGFSADS